MSEPNKNHVGLYNAVGQSEGFNSNQVATDLQAQPYVPAQAIYLNVNMASTNTDSPDQMATDLQAQPYVPAHAIHFPLHDNVNMASTNTDSPGQMPTNLQPHAQDALTMRLFSP